MRERALASIVSATTSSLPGCMSESCPLQHVSVRHGLTPSFSPDF
jgi:hypothetical protein